MEKASSGSSGAGVSGKMYEARDPVVIRGDSLTINDVVRVARYKASVRLTDEEEVLRRVNASNTYIINATEACRPVKGTIPPTCKPIYGVTTSLVAAERGAVARAGGPRSRRYST